LDLKSSPKNYIKSPALILFLATLVIYTLGLNAIWSTDHTLSFLELDWAIWNNHSFALGKIIQSLTTTCTANPIQYKVGVLCSVDDFAYHGEYYTANAPGTSFLMLPFSIAGFVAGGGFSLYGQPLVYSEFLIALTNAIATVVVYKISKLYFRTTTAIFLALSYAFSTISWPLATFLFQSDPSAAFDLIAAYFALRVTRSATGLSSPRLREVIFCGLALSVASTVDYLNAILIPIFIFYFIYILQKQSNLSFSKNFVIFLLAALAGIGAIAAYNYLSYGSPLITGEQLYDNGKNILSLFPQGLDYGLVLNLFSPYRGLFVYSPILILGLLGFYKMLRSNTYDKEAIFFLAIFCGITFLYSKWYALDGGLSYGPRYIVSAIPFLLIPAGFVIEGSRHKARVTIAYVLFSIGVITNGIAAFTSALAGTSNSWLRSPFLYSALPLFLKGSFDSWYFISLPKIYSWTISLLIIAGVILVPAMVYLKWGRHEALHSDLEQPPLVSAPLSILKVISDEE
jgi:hypothetical protein